MVSLSWSKQIQSTSSFKSINSYSFIAFNLVWNPSKMSWKAYFGFSFEKNYCIHWVRGSVWILQVSNCRIIWSRMHSIGSKHHFHSSIKLNCPGFHLSSSSISTYFFKQIWTSFWTSLSLIKKWVIFSMNICKELVSRFWMHVYKFFLSLDVRTPFSESYSNSYSNLKTWISSGL